MGQGFQEQFTNIKRLRGVAGGFVRFIDLNPGLLRQVPIILAPGWGGTFRTYELFGEELFKAGCRVILIEHERRGKVRHDFPHQFHKAKNILSVMKTVGIKRADIVTHSESSINAALAVALEPARFRSLILFSPAGLIGKDTFLIMGVRILKKIAYGLLLSVANKHARRQNLEGLKYILKNPKKALAEGREIARAAVHTVIAQMRKRNINVYIVASRRDHVFPLEKIHRINEANQLGELVVITDKRSGHDDMVYHPKRSAETVLEIVGHA